MLHSTPGGPEYIIGPKATTTPGNPYETPVIEGTWKEPETVSVEFPHVIDFQEAQNFASMKKLHKECVDSMEKTMRASLDQIEKGYNEYVAKMKEGFNTKCKQYIKIDDNLNKNNEFICGHARDVQAIMEDHRDAIIDEKNIEYSKLKSAQLAWKKEIEEIY